MSDIFRERLQKFWKAYGDYVIAAAVLVFAGIAGFQLWQRHQADERAKASNAMTAAQQITDPAKAVEAFENLAKDSPGGYALVARLSAANALAASGKAPDAVAAYKQIASEDNGVVGSVARLRAAWTLAESGTRKELADLLAPLDKDGSAWAPMAHEVLAYADFRALDTKAAQTKYQALSRDTAAPAALRRRAEVMAAYLAGGGAASFGTVPPDASPVETSPAPAAAAPPK